MAGTTRQSWQSMGPRQMLPRDLEGGMVYRRRDRTRYMCIYKNLRVCFRYLASAGNITKLMKS